MQPERYLRTKLLPPRPARRVLARPRLLARLRAALDLPATIVCADAGCGKTTLVADFTRSLDAPCVWYQLDPSDYDLAAFFAYLTHGLRQRHPRFGAALLGLLEEGGAAAAGAGRAGQLVEVFVGEVGEHVEEKTVLVLDDYHHVGGSAAVAAAVDRLLAYLPDALHVVLTTRAMPNLAVTRLRSKGLVEVVDRRDLLFTPEEVHALFAETFGKPLPPEVVRRYHEKTDGWVTALQLIRQSLDRAQSLNHDHADDNHSRFTAALQQSELDIFDFFAEEVLQFESDEDRQMLGRISLLERVDPAICEAALGIANPRDRLRALARRNVFISHTYAQGADEEYRLHPLFRNFLSRRLVNYAGAEEVKRLHLACADYFLAARLWDLAAHHYMEAQAADALAGMLAEHGAELAQAGRYETIKRAYRHVPEAALAARPRAIITRADVALLEGDLPLALALYTQASQAAGADQEVEAEARRGLASIARAHGDYERALQLAASAIEIAPQSHGLRARCFNMVALCYFDQYRDTRRAIENWRPALEEARLAEDDRFARIVLHNLGLPYSIEGDFHEAIRWFGQMIEGREAGSETAPFPQKAKAHLNIGLLRIVQGRLDEAQTHLERALEQSRSFNLKRLTAQALEGFGNLHRERGEFGRALAFYDEAARACREAGVPITDHELLDERAALYLRMGELAKAERDAEEYYRARAEGSPTDRAVALITRGRVAMAAGRRNEAEAVLREAAEIARDNHFHYNEARAETSLARLCWDDGRKDEAITHLARAVALSVRYDYSYWLQSECVSTPALFQAALGAGVAVDYLAQIIPAESLKEEWASGRAGERGTGQSHLPLSHPPTPPFPHSHPAPAVELFIERPSFDLAIHMLGPVEVYRSPNELLQDVWRLVKALHMLCYIASRRNHRAPKETLVDIFWAEADPQAVAKNFHPMISHLRKALNSGQVVKKDFLLYREGAYLLNPQYRYYLDTQEFERVLGDARQARQGGDPQGAAQFLTQAIRLYRGDFLEEVYYPWVEELQTYYQDLYLEALKDLIAWHGERGDHEQVIRYGQMVLAKDAYREDVHCKVMEAYVQSGNRAAAIEQFDSLRRMLRRELGVDPLPSTIAYYEALIKG
ncbi:MAG TPA: BTAD domain-containing putative transcriptional regulator [Blastocatellia bacterium]|nr:BTAD domain-containing putative transcriptional regulator [Blastocatellia bacterium]